MAATSSSWRQIAAGLLALLLVHGLEVAAQQQDPTAAPKACYTSCEIYWTALRNTTGSNQKLLAQYNNSSQKADDYYCSSIANVSACFSACQDMFSQFVYQDTKYALTTVKAISSKCFTDEAQCRTQDSELWCNTYNQLSCSDIANSYGECYIGVQALRGCHLTNPTHKSQRMVLAKLMDNVLYCLNDVDFYSMSPDDGDSGQACAQYIPTVCLSYITDPKTGLYDPYYIGNVTCSDIQSIKDCIGETLTQTITFNGKDYAMMCQPIPNGATLFSRLLSAINGLLPCSQTTSVNNMTSVTGPTTGLMAGEISTNITTQRTAGTQVSNASTIPTEVSAVATKAVTVEMTKQSSTTSHTLCVSSTSGSGLVTSSGLLDALLSISIAAILSVIGF